MNLYQLALNRNNWNDLKNAHIHRIESGYRRNKKIFVKFRMAVGLRINKFRVVGFDSG